MGKIEDMRRQREAQFAQDAGAEPAPDGGDGEEVPSEDSDASTGKCSVCGKALAVQNGVVGSHQKGLGKFCPGSRKPPK